ncbi:MAG: DUF1192 domain-containing protein [Alphaproteobacteria bacterium]
MEDEDLKPKVETPFPRKLEGMAIEALNDYIGELEAEIARVRVDISTKQAALSAADSVFRK